MRPGYTTMYFSAALCKAFVLLCIYMYIYHPALSSTCNKVRGECTDRQGGSYPFIFCCVHTSSITQRIIETVCLHLCETFIKNNNSVLVAL